MGATPRVIGTKSSTGELADACRRFTFSEIEQLTGAVSLVATCSRTSRRPVARQGWVPLQVVQERRGRMNLAGIAERSAWSVLTVQDLLGEFLDRGQLRC